MDEYPQHTDERAWINRFNRWAIRWSGLISLLSLVVGVVGLLFFISETLGFFTSVNTVLPISEILTFLIIASTVFIFISSLKLIIKQDSKPELTKPPGTKLMALVRLCYSAKSIEKIFEPIYADFCEEHFAALAAGEKWHARWIRVRYYKDFGKAVSLFGVVRLAKTVFEYWEKIA